tara:strand:- start:97 stop:891 length:795 start_codon:yes stop_codon:yes gene_type:complete
MDKKYNFLKPLKTPNLIRLGRKADGGYVVDKKIIQNTNTLVSFGLGSDWSFELDYLKINKDVKIHMYDFQVSKITYIKSILKYLKRFVTLRCKFKDLKARYLLYKNYSDFLNLSCLKFYPEKITYPIKNKNDTDLDKVLLRILNNEKIILKIDIEGYEFNLIDQIVENRSRITMLIMEYHWLDKNEELFLKSVKKIQQYFDIIHIHGNNHCEKLLSGLPIALEMTLINKDSNNFSQDYVKKFPIKDLDFPNNPYKEDLFFSFNE